MKKEKTKGGKILSVKSVKPERTEKNVEQKENQIHVFLKGLIVILSPCLVASIVYMLSWWKSVFSVIFSYIYVPSFVLTLALVFPVLHLYWAHHEVIGYFIEEGYCIIFAWGGENFSGADLRDGNRYFNDDWDIVEDPKKEESPKKGKESLVKRMRFWLRAIKPPKGKIRILGMGLYLWPFNRIFEYEMTWAKKTEEGERKSKTERLSRILLKRYVYSFRYSNMEDADGMPLDVDLAIELQIINPVKAVFKVEKWYRAIINLTEGDIRGYVGERFYKKDLINLSSKEGGSEQIKPKEGVGERIKEIMEKALDSFENDYGVHAWRIEVQQIVPSRKEDLEATLQEMRAKREREAIEIKAQGEAFKVAQDSMGVVMQALSVLTGEKIEELQAVCKVAPEKFEEKYGVSIKRAYDFAEKRLGFINKGRIEIETSGGAGKEGSVGSDGGINMDRLIETMVALEMTKQTLSQRSEKSVPEGGGVSKEDAVKALKKELGYKY